LAETEDHLQENVTKLNIILKLYNMRISTNKTKAMAMEGKYMRRAKIVIDDIGIELTSSFKHLRCNISIYKMSMDLEDNVQKYNKLNGCIKRYLGKNMKKEIKLRLRNIISKPALQYGSETSFQSLPYSMVA
jgi:ferritin-like protein